MIKDMGIKYTLTGHSERRSLYHETDKEVAIKTKNALDNGLTVLACIGELL
jgi:triosephosphate isomerase